jgi:hypothetical protein
MQPARFDHGSNISQANYKLVYRSHVQQSYAGKNLLLMLFGLFFANSRTTDTTDKFSDDTELKKLAIYSMK